MPVLGCVLGKIVQIMNQYWACATGCCSHHEFCEFTNTHTCTVTHTRQTQRGRQRADLLNTPTISSVPAGSAIQNVLGCTFVPPSSGCVGSYQTSTGRRWPCCQQRLLRCVAQSPPPYVARDIDEWASGHRDLHPPSQATKATAAITLLHGGRPLCQVPSALPAAASWCCCPPGWGLVGSRGGQLAGRRLARTALGTAGLGF